MKRTRECADCGIELERMDELQVKGLGHSIDIATDTSKDGILGALGARESLAPVPYVCPECRRVQFYVED